MPVLPVQVMGGRSQAREGAPVFMGENFPEWLPLQFRAVVGYSLPVR